jgi:hypothetical protein
VVAVEGCGEGGASACAPGAGIADVGVAATGFRFATGRFGDVGLDPPDGFSGIGPVAADDGAGGAACTDTDGTGVGVVGGALDSWAIAGRTVPRTARAA